MVNHSVIGSPRNHVRWRRAKRRVSCAIASTVASYPRLPVKYSTRCRYPRLSIAFASGGIPAASRPSTSAKKPSDIICCTRALIRTSSSAMSRSITIRRAPGLGMPWTPSGVRQLDIGFPVTSYTSSARMMRLRSADGIRSADSGSTFCKRSCSNAVP